ncbi:hypothetical protein Q5P01_005028 [Channa striata]|uniref:Retinitis pigmentosa 1-like 1 protein n=1 Tax=Channa striata TaxID=64152 RepID=A0AA88NGS8_CHASR|nr:hypothetical protein Q5P01_005028 [Channa striata]
MQEQATQYSKGKRSCNSKSSRQDRQIADGSNEAKSANSAETCRSAQPKRTKHHGISHAESKGSDLSQTLSSSDVVKEMCEIPVRESESTATEGIITGPLEVSDNKGDNNTDADDFDLVPSSLPNASPTEVVNEWLKTIPAESDMYDMEELSENCEADKTDRTTKEIQKHDNSDSAAENTEDIGVLKNNGPNNDCHTGSEAPNEDNTSTQRDDASKVFHSSVQVMKVLLNPKLDRCNSLPEVSPVYGRKLSTSARGLLDCLVKLQLIDHDPKNANEMAKRYQELMNILQSLWLCDPPESKQVLEKGHRHSVDNEFNHTSSSGVDVNSGSTGSGKSSDGVKTSDGGNHDVSQPLTDADMLRVVQEVGQAEDQRTFEREVEGMHEEKQKEDDPATDDTIRSNDSPRELPETPSSPNKSSETDRTAPKHSGEAETESPEDIKSDSPLLVQRAQLAKRISQDPDPVWVLKLLTKIERQFMTHYINAMREFKVRWSLDDNEQLNEMISELETEVRKRIEKSVDRELRKIQGRAGLPRPPKETMSRASTTQTEERRRRLKIMVKQSVDTQTEKSTDSATGTSYSDQRSESDVEYCPCETCIRKKVTSNPPLPAEVMNTAPVLPDFDLKRILVMKTNDPDKAQKLTCASHAENHIETAAAVTLVERPIVKAVREAEEDEEQHDTEDNFAFVLEAKEAESAAESAMGDDANAAEETPVVASPELQADKEQAVEVEPNEDTITANEIMAASEDKPNKGVEAFLAEESHFASTTRGELAKKGEGELEEATAEVTTAEDDTAAEETAVAAGGEDESDKGEDVEEEKRDNEGNIHVMGTENPADENNGIDVASESEEVTKQNVIAADKETVTIGEDGTKDEAAEDEGEFVSEAFTEPESDTDEAVDAGPADDEEEDAATSHDELNEEAADVTIAESETTADDVTSMSKHESDESDKEELGEEGMENHEELQDEETTADDTSKEPATTEDDVAVEKATAVTCKDESKEDNVEDETAAETTIATTENESDNEETANGEETASASDDDSAEDVTGNEDEAVEENHATGNKLSKEPTEEAITENEHALEMETVVTSEDEPIEEAVEATANECKNSEEADVATATEDESHKEETAEESTGDNEEELSSTSGEESAQENYGTVASDGSKEPAEEAETLDEMTTEETAEDKAAAEETSVAGITENESDKEEADNGEEAVATSDNDFANDAVTNADEITEDDTTGDELSEEPAEIATTEDETEKDTDAGSEDESKKEFAEATKAEDENAAGGSDVAATTEDEPDKDDDVETEVDENKGLAADTRAEDGTTDTDKAETAEHESATDKDNALTSEDEGEDSSAAEEADDVATTERDSDKDAAVKEEILAPSADESESEEIAENVTNEDENGKEIDATMTGEDLKNAAENVADTTEHESDEAEEEAAEEAAASNEDDSAQVQDATSNDESVEENDNTDDAAVDKDEVKTDDNGANVETATEAENPCEEEISEADESNEEQMEETTGGEEFVDEQNNADADPEPANGESYKSGTENESEEERYEQATDENKSENIAATDATETAGEEDISKVSNDNESGDEDSEGKSENENVDETAEEDKLAMDENKTLGEKDLVQIASAKEIQETDDAASYSDELVGTAGDESEEAENESEASAEHKSGTEAVTTGDDDEEHGTAAEESGEPEMAGNETTEGEGGEECGTQSESEGDESAQDDRRELAEGEDKDDLEDDVSECITERHQKGPNDETQGPDDVVELRPGDDDEVEGVSEEDAEKGENTSNEDDVNDGGQTETNVTQCECINIRNGSHDTDEDNDQEEPETPKKNWCRIQGDSADGEDEAEEDSDGPEKETDDDEQDAVSCKTRDKLVIFNRAAGQTTLIQLDTLNKVNAESEDGAYADVEDSETELNSQEDITGLESKKFSP